MRKAVLLAYQARSLFNEERWLNDKQQPERAAGRSDKPRIRLCLSLGSFGASLNPTQEFGGFYPPPYGPRGYSADGLNLNWIGDENTEEEAIEALTAFHLERLSLFAQDSGIWSLIDVIAFETVPLAREAIAIRRTMGRLQEKGIGVGKQWWISFVFPEGQCPEMVDAIGTRLTAFDLAWATLSPNPPDPHGGKILPIPHGIGVNCTGVEYLPHIVKEMEGVCKNIKEKPFLVLCPNGGDQFDESLGAWIDSETKSEWEIKLVDLVDRILNSPDVNWAGVLAGGCCRCDSERISRLSRLLK
jgi:homocysteine S-methyltransferase